jgi:hypothetical protein
MAPHQPPALDTQNQRENLSLENDFHKQNYFSHLICLDCKLWPISGTVDCLELGTRTVFCLSRLTDKVCSSLVAFYEFFKEICFFFAFVYKNQQGATTDS